MGPARPDANSHAVPQASIGRTFYTLCNAYNDPDNTADCISSLEPPGQYDAFLRQFYYTAPANTTPRESPWVDRALGPNLTSAPVKRYKPVDRKVRPVPSYMPNPSAQTFKPIPSPELEPLPLEPPSLANFEPSERLTRERLQIILETVPSGFLNAREIDLLVFVLKERQFALAFTDAERGTFSPRYFPDYEIPTIEHVPWQLPPNRVPRAIEDDVYTLLTEQRDAGKYEPSSASYRSRIIIVEKKTGKYRICHDLQPLNGVTIRDSALPPNVNDFAESFVGYAIYMIADLFSGYDNRRLAEISRDLTTFDCLIGAHRLTTLPQGFCNAVQEFQRCITHVIRDEVPHHAGAFVDDVGIKGPCSTYNNMPVVPGSPIRRFVYEFLTTVNRILCRFELAGITASGYKLVAATPELHIVGSIASLLGWHLAHGVVNKVLKWMSCTNVSEVRSFLGIAGVARRWIQGFSIIVRPLTRLTRKSVDFAWTNDAQEAMDLIKQRVTTAPVLKPIDYQLARAISPHDGRPSNHGIVIVAVDSSKYGAGWVLYQMRETDKHPALFGSCTFSATESRYSQPKLELYGVFRALKELRHRIWGLYFRLDVDAKFSCSTSTCSMYPRWLIRHLMRCQDVPKLRTTRTNQMLRSLRSPSPDDEEPRILS